MRVDVLGVAFDNCTKEEAVEASMELLGGSGSHYVVTPNPEIVEACRENEELRAVVNAADLILPDGIGIIYGAKILGTPLRERVPGIEYACALMGRMAEEGRSLFLLGARPGYAEQAAERLQETYPGLRIAGTNDGYFQENDPVAAKIRSSGAEAVFVCLGSPKQEQWMARYGADTGARLLVGLGGSLDIFSGNVRRAPPVFCRLGLEWFYRLIKEPRRIGRMMKLPLFLIHVMQEKGKR